MFYKETIKALTHDSSCNFTKDKEKRDSSIIGCCQWATFLKKWDYLTQLYLINNPDGNGSFIIRDRGVDINGERNFKIFTGMLLGLRGYPDLRSEIISDISRETQSVVKKEF